jgi:hypothetical protein
MQRRSRSILTSLMLFVGVAGCGLADAETNSLSMAVTASPLVVPVGTIVDVMTSATGQSLIRTVIEYGDGFADSIGTVGSEQRSTRPHVYTFPGSMTIRATAFDALLGEAFDEVTIEVQDTVPSS